MNCVRCLTDYYEELEKEFHILYMEALDRFGEKTIHDMRVNMKRQTAFFRLIEALDERFSAEEAMEGFAKIYNRAGKLRNIQVERKVIARDENQLHLEKYISGWLSQREELQKEAFREYEIKHSLIPIRETGKWVKDCVARIPGEGLQGRYLQYLKKLLKKIAGEIGEEEVTEEQLHLLRKDVKEFFYNLQLADRIFDKATIGKVVYDRLNRLQTLLGDWHDHDFTLHKLLDSGIPCPTELLKKLDSDKAFFNEQLQIELASFGKLRKLTEKEIKRLFASDVLQAPAIPRHPPVLPSFTQENVGERFK
jgi:CHAD domain-containing protein